MFPVSMSSAYGMPAMMMQQQPVSYSMAPGYAAPMLPAVGFQNPSMGLWSSPSGWGQPMNANGFGNQMAVSSSPFGTTLMTSMDPNALASGGVGSIASFLGSSLSSFGSMGNANAMGGNMASYAMQPGLSGYGQAYAQPVPSNIGNIGNIGNVGQWMGQAMQVIQMLFSVISQLISRIPQNNSNPVPLYANPMNSMNSMNPMFAYQPLPLDPFGYPLESPTSMALQSRLASLM